MGRKLNKVSTWLFCFFLLNKTTYEINHCSLTALTGLLVKLLNSPPRGGGWGGLGKSAWAYPNLVGFHRERSLNVNVQITARRKKTPRETIQIVNENS